MGKVIELFCNYCNRFKPFQGFKQMRHVSGTPRRMCPACQEIRQKPRAELEALAARDKQERNQR